MNININMTIMVKNTNLNEFSFLVKNLKLLINVILRLDILTH